MKLIIQKQTTAHTVPYELLLLADPSPKIVNEYLQRGECYTASLSDQSTVGVFVLLKTRPETIEIVNIAVREEEQGKGIGKRMIYEAIEIAKQQGAKTIEIGTGNSSVTQLALYQRCGFRIIGVDLDFFLRHYEEEIFENGIQCRDMIRLRLDI